MTYNTSNPALGATIQTGALLSVVAVGGVALFEGLRAVLEDIGEQRYASQYHDALSRAVHHGRTLRTVAEVAVDRVGELEMEVAALRAACAQRQDVIDALVGGSK